MGGEKIILDVGGHVLKGGGTAPSLGIVPPPMFGSPGQKRRKLILGVVIASFAEC